MKIFGYLLFLLPVVVATNVEIRRNASDVCSQISDSLIGQVYYPLSLGLNFASDTNHFMTSSSQTPTCVVEVTSPQDVSTVLKLVGNSRTPFAVKSGGHTSNPGFSSTPGVFISLVRIKQITLSPDKSTVEIGLGNLWTEVYAALDGTGVNIVGGRVAGPGTGGFTLGGGYSWKTNQFGLACDTVKSYNLVLPNGTITVVDSSKPDLFFALKGGLNRFGIVTSIVYKTVPQTNDIYAGYQIFAADQVPALIAATSVFQSTNTDPKAQVILTLNVQVVPEIILISFYDGPNRPAAFDVYNNITALVSTLQTQSFKSFSTVVPSQATAIQRGSYTTLSTTGLTTGFMNAVYNESIFWGTLAIANVGTFVSYEIEPFGNYGIHATDSAYPHANSPIPLNIYYAWQLEAEDAHWKGVMQQSINHLIAVAKAEGIYSPNMYAYPNYAVSAYTGAQLYGPTNAARLRAIQAKYDPTRVMLLAGGYTF